MLSHLERRIVGEITHYERSMLRHGSLWFFLVLFSYYILRPIREQIGATYGIENLSYLFWTTFSVMLVAIPAYSWLVGRVHRSKLVPCIYVIFVSSLVLFWLAMHQLPRSSQIWIARGLFVWISIFGLFVVSFFWSVVGDMLTTEQGRRVFGVMAGGGTVGGLIGSQVASQLVGYIGVANLLLFPTGLLVCGLFVYLMMERSFRRLAGESGANRSGAATGGNPFAGFTAVFSSRYLLAICCFGGFLAICGTSVYFQQAEIVNATFREAPYDAASLPVAGSEASESEIAEAKKALQEAASQQATTKYFANVNFAVSILTMIFQFLVVGRLMRWWGLGLTLAMLPIAYVIGISALAMAPVIEVLAIVSVLGRSAEYGLCNPAREVLFTAVVREDRYKAKSFIDTVVRRGGDSAAGAVYKTARESLGFAITTLSWIMIPFAVCWIGLAIFIGKENKKIIRKQNEAQEESERTHDAT